MRPSRWVTATNALSCATCCRTSAAAHLIIATGVVGGAILAEAAFFLGLGVSELDLGLGPDAARGTDESITGVYWTSVFPGLAIALAVFGFFVFGDALRMSSIRGCGGGGSTRTLPTQDGRHSGML